MLLSLLPRLQCLWGGAPVTQTRASPTGQLQTKTSLVGVFWVLLHISITIYCVYKSVCEVEEQPEKFKEKNNMMRAIIDLGHSVAFFLQPLMALGTCLQRHATVRFLNSIEECDLFLCVGVSVKPLTRSLQLVDRVFSVAVILVVLGNVPITHWLFLGLYQEAAGFHDMYLHLFPLASYAVNVLVACAHLHALSLRMGAFTRVLRCLHEQCGHAT